MPQKAKNKSSSLLSLPELANARAKKQQIAVVNKQEKQGHYDALFNSKRPATEPALVVVRPASPQDEVHDFVEWLLPRLSDQTVPK
jgi:hypothetical protein